MGTWWRLPLLPSRTLSCCCCFFFCFCLATSLHLPLEGRAKCPDPAVPSNSRVSVTKEDRSPGTVAAYTCDKGYELFGTSSLVCSAEGKWSGELPFCGSNVAQRKPANQSTTARGGAAPSANDGDTTTVHDGHRCSETLKEVSPWWQVDLLRPYSVRAVRIHTRACCGHPPLQEIEIRVGNSTTIQRNPLCAWYPDTIDYGLIKVFDCKRALVGQYVSVQMVGSEGSLSLCEMEVISSEELSPSRCSRGGDPEETSVFNGTCFEFHTGEGRALEGARDWCKNRGGPGADVVWGLTEPVRNFLVAQLERRQQSLKTKLIWIGAKRDSGPVPGVASGGTWRWLDGSPVGRPSWGRDQPNNYNGEQNCVVLDGGRDWLWNDVGCHLDYLPWICRAPPSSCGSPDKHANTSILFAPKSSAELIDDDGHPINSTITYSCPLGHVLVGDQHRMCQSEGLWSGRAPFCKYVDCGPVKNIQEGSHSLKGEHTTFGSVVEYSCKDNFTLQGPTRRRCQEDSTWEGEEPRCLYNWCAAPATVANGVVQSSGQRAGDTAQYSCASGHVLTGEAAISCELGGHWSSDPPSCRFVDCGVPRAPLNGTFSLLNLTTSFGSWVEFTCQMDHWLSGPQMRMCDTDGSWTGEQPVCQLIYCDEPEVPTGSYVTGYDLSVHSEIEYHCEEGHLMSGELTRTCEGDGKWSGEPPSCIYVDCGRVPTVPYGSVQYVEGITSVGSHLIYNCSRNYQLDGHGHRVCQDDGKWSGETPVCKEVRCREPERPANSVLSVTGNDRNFARTLFAGAQEVGRSAATYRIGSIVKYRCERGYKVVGEPLRTCEDSGEWSGSPPICVFVDCGIPDYVSHGYFQLTSNATHFGALVLYECEEKFRLEGHGRRLCLENSTWSSTSPQCVEIRCSQPEVLEGSEVEASNLAVGSEARYKCVKGRKQLEEGAEGRNRQCLSGGTWSGRPPSCPWVDCGEPSAVSNGRVFVVNRTTLFASVAEYHCSPSYRRIGPFLRKCTEYGLWSGTQPVCEEDPNGLGDENGLAEGQGAELSESQLGIWIGVGLGTVLVVILILVIICMRMRKATPVKNTENVEGMAKKENETAEVMSYASLNDNYNHIYDSVNEDLYENERGLYPYSQHPNGTGHFRKGGGGVGGGVGGGGGRPAMVTINGVAVQ